MKSGEITAFLSLIFVLIVSFTGGILEVTSIQLAKNMGRINMERAMECVFAEYQKELLDAYDVFALEASYETGNYSEELIKERLEYYSRVNSDITIERIEFLSDENGTPFYEMVNHYMKHKYGIDFVEEQLEKTEFWKKQEEDAAKYETENADNDRELEDILRENNSELPEHDNPLVNVSELKRSPLLNLVMPETMPVSEKNIDLESAISHRERMEGYGDFSAEEESYGPVDKLLFGEYILEHFDSATDQKGNILEYEAEYILAGKNSDRENLKEVLSRLLKLRFVANYTQLLGNPEKQAQARALALGISTVLAVPAITEAAAQGILLAWAYEESLADIKVLLSGETIGESGMNYEAYLRVLLFLENKEALTMRTLDLIETNLQKVEGLDFMKMDYCVTKIGIKNDYELRRGITYTFPSYFAYN